MKIRVVSSIVAGMVAVGLIHMTMAAEGGKIHGTVKAAGLASNADAIVYIVQAPGKFTAPAKAADMDQRNMQFVPHALPIVVGTTVRFLNSDPSAHNVFSSDHEKYDLGTWTQGKTKDQSSRPARRRRVRTCSSAGSILKWRRTSSYCRTRSSP